MYSTSILKHRHRTNTINKLIHAMEYNKLHPEGPPLLCYCNDNVNTKINKTYVSNPDVLDRMTRNQRISQLVNYSKGGNTQFGNYYLGEPQIVNCFGRVEGMPGGSGAPPRNNY